MFTTIHESESKRFIYENTVRNWQLLKPDIIPLLFTDIDPKMSTSIGHFAMQQGWKVLPVPKASAKGNAILRHMFLKAQDEFDTPFYCYANGDILFDRNLTDTVRFLQSSAYGGHIDKLLVVGRRRNWSIDKGLILRDLSQVGHYAINSSLFIPDAQDYFPRRWLKKSRLWTPQKLWQHCIRLGEMEIPLAGMQNLKPISTMNWRETLILALATLLVDTLPRNLKMEKLPLWSESSMAEHVTNGMWRMRKAHLRDNIIIPLGIYELSI